MIPYGRHNIDQQDIDAVVDVLKSDSLTCGSVVDAFEKELATITSAKHAVSCSNGTTALHLAMLGLKIGIGDVVLVPAITFLASANAARYVGADVLFVDIDPSTGLMTAETLENAILKNRTKNLKAVVNVHFAGQCENLEDIYKISKKYNLTVIEDASHAVGTIYKDRNGNEYPIGCNTFSDMTTFSFHPVKTIAMGEGGAVTTNDFEMARQLKVYRSHGMVRDPEHWEETNAVGPWYYEMQELGYNYRISDINCALGLSQLKKIQSFKLERAKLVQFYDEAFKDNFNVKPIRKLEYSDTAWHLYVVNIDFQKMGEERSEMMQRLKEAGIGTQVHYIPVYKQPYYKKLYGNMVLPGAESYYKNCISLPLYIGLQQSQQEKIIKVLIRHAE